MTPTPPSETAFQNNQELTSTSSSEDLDPALKRVLSPPTNDEFFKNPDNWRTTSKSHPTQDFTPLRSRTQLPYPSQPMLVGSSLGF